MSITLDTYKTVTNLIQVEIEVKCFHLDLGQGKSLEGGIKEFHKCLLVRVAA